MTTADRLSDSRTSDGSPATDGTAAAATSELK